jgi:hypothetical protein
MNRHTKTTRGAAWRWLARVVRQFGPEVCWLGMIGMILLANTKAAGVTALIGCSFAWGLGFMTACICKPNTSVSYDRPQGGN